MKEMLKINEIFGKDAGNVIVRYDILRILLTDSK